MLWFEEHLRKHDNGLIATVKGKARKLAKQALAHCNSITTNIELEKKHVLRATK